MWAMAAAMLIVVGNTVIGLREVQHIEAYNRAVEAAANGDWITAAVQLRLAQQVEPGLSFYRRQLAFAAGYLAEDDLAYRQEAIVQYQAALAGLDQLAIDRANFGCLLWTDGQQKPALQEMRRAKKLDPGDPVYRLNLGYYLELTGDWEGAQREYVEIITIWPEIIQSSYWQQTEQRAEALPQMAWQAAQNMGVLNAVQLLLETQNLEAARQLYEQYLQEGPVEPATQHLAWGKILLAAGELETAHAEFEAAVQANPRTAEAYLRLSQIALAQKRVGEAGQYIQAALFLLQSSETLYQAGQVEAAAGDTSQALKRYEAAFDLATLQSELNLTRYATEVARRRPLPANYLPCLRRLYPTRLLTEITQAEGNLLENLGRPEEAIPLIERLRYYEPTLPPVLEISCQDQVKVCSQ
jgi:tetratricopeptide (TPR) repeat protein